MDSMEIAHARLHNQHLVGDPLDDPVAVVRHLGAVQAQEFPVAKWSLAQRTHGYDNAAVQRLLDEGSIMRTHALRPTWHFLAAADIGWIQALTGPRVHAFNAYYNRQHGLDEESAARTNKAITAALRGGNHLTRGELAGALAKAGHEATGNRLAYIVMRAELDGLIANGVMRGKQQTYALISERVAAPLELTGDEALAEFTRRYLASHGPATIKDFAWWSSLTATQIKRGLALLGSAVASEDVDGRTFWFVPGPPPPRQRSPRVIAMQGYDEYVVSYTESRAVTNIAGRTIAIANENTTIHPLALDSQLVGHWRRRVDKGGVIIQPVLAMTLAAAQRKALDREIARYAAFHGPGVVIKPSIMVGQ
jgi:Winged helix DNA-binding domain